MSGRTSFGARSWIKICKEGSVDVLEIDKSAIMRCCNIPARDLRLLDPLFLYPSTILGRERAIVVNLEQIRCIITADEVILLNTIESPVLKYVWDLQRRLHGGKSVVENYCKLPSHTGLRFGDPDLDASDNAEARSCPEHPWRYRKLTDGLISTSCDKLPFELKALDVALEAACIYLDKQATTIKEEACPILDQLMIKVTTLSLERARRLKRRLLAMTRRVQKVRDQIEHLMNDDDDMMELCLTEKKTSERYSFQNPAPIEQGFSSALSSPKSDKEPPFGLESVNFHELTKGYEDSPLIRIKHQSKPLTASGSGHSHDFEILLETYFAVVDQTLSRLTSLREHIDDTGVLINIQLDTLRNRLIQFKVYLSVAHFVLAIFQVVTGIFGMNTQIELFDEPWTFKWVIIISAVGCSLIFILLVGFFKHRHSLLVKCGASSSKHPQFTTE